MNEYAKPPFPRQTQAMPGSTEALRPRPDHGEASYRGSGRLRAKRPSSPAPTAASGRAVAIVNADASNPMVLPYAATKGAIQNFTAGLAQFLVEKGIPQTPALSVPSTMSEDTVEEFGANVPMKRPGQPAELGTAY